MLSLLISLQIPKMNYVVAVLEIDGLVLTAYTVILPEIQVMKKLSASTNLQL